MALHDLGVFPVLSWCWELDEECKRVTSGHSPQVHQANLSDAASRGDWEPSDKIGCHRCQPDFQQSWQLLSELAEKSVEPHAALFENLVDLVALPPAAQ